MNRIQNVIRAIMPANRRKTGESAQYLSSRDISTSLTMMTMHARSLM